MSEEPDIQAACFAICETPVCVWDTDAVAVNTDFIENIQPDYFRHLADTHEPGLSGEAHQFASTAIGTAYSQALETFFAVLFATLQAPHFVVGWLSKYRQEDLRELVNAIDRSAIRSKVPLADQSWEGIVAALHQLVTFTDEAGAIAIKKKVAVFWRQLARDFLDPLRSDQYNTIKHGFRSQLGGVQLHVGEPQADGGPPPPEKYVSLGGSKYGTCFFALESLGCKYHYRIKRKARNWQPDILAQRLRLISYSLRNILAFLKIAHRIGSGPITFEWPEVAAFDQALRVPGGVVSLTFLSPTIERENIDELSKEEILEVYERRSAGNANPDSKSADSVEAK